MKKNKIILCNPNSLIEELRIQRELLAKTNICENTLKTIQKFLSPDTGEKYFYSVERSSLISKNGKAVPVINGIPDFAIFSKTALDDKNKQSEFHDNEDNEPFDEIVFRPYNFNRLHAKIWIEHLFYSGKIIEKTLNLSIENSSILNCGCGGGFEAQFFASQGAEIVGFDISQLRVEAASVRFALNNLKGCFYKGDAATLPFADESFDLVIYHDSLHHVPMEEIPGAIREAARVAKNAVILLEANDSPLRMLLEGIGLSTSIEISGNYVFRFRKSLIQFWCNKYNMQLAAYRTRFVKREHKPRLYGLPIINLIVHYCIKFIGLFLNKFGNEAIIILKKQSNPDKIKSAS
jgi:ubiquinone/menaquinone biosynthesis C-methylase UbiE